MIIDVTDPRNPVEKALISRSPVPAARRKWRACVWARSCPADTHGQGLPDAQRPGQRCISGYEIWDVTDVARPCTASALPAFARRTRNGGSATPASRTCPAARLEPGGRCGGSRRRCSSTTGQSDDAPPVYIRTFGLPGRPADGTGRCRPRCTARSPRTSIRKRPAAGARRTAERRHRQPHLRGVGRRRRRRDDDHRPQEAAAASPTAARGCRQMPTARTADRSDELIGPKSPTVGYFTMSPDQGGHTSMPVFGMKPPSYRSFNEFRRATSCSLASEATADGRTAAATRRRTGASSST